MSDFIKTTPPETETIKLQKPIIPVKFFQDDVLECGRDLMIDLLKSGDRRKMQWLLDILLFADEYMETAVLHGGKVTPEQNSMAIEYTINYLQLSFE